MAAARCKEVEHQVCARAVRWNNLFRLGKGNRVEGLSGSQASLAAPPHTCTSQSITLLSQPPEASCLESWLKLTVSTLRW